MIDKPTLFILGAGASQPYGYPTGKELRTDIIKNCLTDFDNLPDIQPSKELAVTTKDDRARLEEFINNFDGSYLKSIDKYLSLNPKDATYGKFAIALSIFKKERESKDRENITDVSEDWFAYLFEKMTSSFNKPKDYEHFYENKIAFITFNYDRLLEHLLYSSFYHSFKENRENIAKKPNDYIPFPIIHVYDVVSPLSLDSWYNRSPNYRKDFFNNYETIKKVCTNIRVIGEERSGENVKDQVKKLLPDYKRIFFLGFGYDQDNLGAIDLLNNVDITWEIYGTAKGMTTKEINDVKNRLPVNRGSITFNHYSGEAVDTSVYATIENKNCYWLLREYL